VEALPILLVTRGRRVLADLAVTSVDRSRTRSRAALGLTIKADTGTLAQKFVTPIPERPFRKHVQQDNPVCLIHSDSRHRSAVYNLLVFHAGANSGLASLS